MKTIKFDYKNEEKNIIYEEYVFNELPIIKNDDIEIIIVENLDFPIINDKENEGDKNKFIEREFNDELEGEYDEDGFFTTPNGSFWDPDGVYFNKEGYDKHGGYYDDNDEYVPGKDWDEEYNCYKDEIHYYDDDYYIYDFTYYDINDYEEDDYAFNNFDMDSIIDEEQFIKIPSNKNNYPKSL